jgi:atypical dual specificity phosphatase
MAEGLWRNETLQALPPNFSFIWEKKVAGSAHPGSGQYLAAALSALRELGIRSILTLTEEPLDGAVLGEYSIHGRFLPIDDFCAPTADQIDEAMQFLTERIEAGDGVLVHCRAGIGRTGTILGCFLVSRGVEPAAAIAKIRRERPGSVEVYAQEYAIYDYARRLKDLGTQGDKTVQP